MKFLSAWEGLGSVLDLQTLAYPHGWDLVQLSDLGQIVTGRTPKGSAEKYFGERTLFVTPRDLNGRRTLEATERQLSGEGRAAMERVLVPAGSVAVSCIGSQLGKAAFIAKEATTNQQINTLVPSGPLDGMYGYYVLSTQQPYLQAITSGSAQPIVNKTTFGKLCIPLPSLPEQRRIAGVLGALDDKIELNRKMNRTLEEMAQALFKSWFIDFDGHDDLVDSELGPIPKGWEVGTLDDISTLNPEAWKASEHPSSVSYVDLSNTKWGRIEEVVEFSWADAPSRARRVLRAGDTIVGCVRPGNGSYAYVSVDGLTGSTGFAALRPKAESMREVLYLAATQTSNIERLAHLADGGAYPAVRPNVVLETSLAIPNGTTFADFSSSARPLFRRIAGTGAESATLTQLRDTLLPKLISGEIRVPEAEEAVEAAP